jgi:hypothetical protein
MDIKQIFAAIAMAVGFVTCVATANAADNEADFLECLGDHQDTDGIGVCCVFYGGDYAERTGECWIDHEAKLEEANPGPSVPPKHPVLTRVDRMPVYALG